MSEVIDSNLMPKSWEVVPLGKFVKSEKGKKPKKESKIKTEECQIPYIDIEAFEQGNIKSWTNGEGCRICYENDFLIVWDGSRSGLVGKGMNGALGSTLVRINFPNMNNPYAFYFMQSKYLEINSRAKGSGTPHVDPDLLWNYSFPIPPLNEQKRIVEKIEELFSELDKGIESLKTAREQLKIYRQSVLKHAFEGKLTENWRIEKNFDDKIAAKVKLKIDADRAKIFSKQLEEWEKEIQFWQENGQVSKKPSKPRKPENPDKASPEQMQKMWDLPISWQWLQVGEFSFVTKLAGFEYTEFVKYDENGDLPVLKAENAGLHGFKPTKYSLVKSSTISHLKRSYISGGELLVVFVGAGTGNVARVPDGQNFFLGPNIGMARVETDQVSTKYLELFLRSPLGKDLILASVKAVAQPSISMGTIRQTPVAIPTIEEQNEMVSLLNDALEKADLLDADLVREINKSEALRQSILKSAFSGKLVAQDPNDEPASVLLERIKAEQANTKRKKS